MTNDFKDCKNLYDFVVLIQSLEEAAGAALTVWDRAREAYWDARHAAERNGFDRELLGRVLKAELHHLEREFSLTGVTSEYDL
ncbi:MAG TPA: hypothetical protein PKE19_00240 [Aestuariivirga sp.]|nr:hypothetical protein [Aestuariivirga sp.]